MEEIIFGCRVRIIYEKSYIMYIPKTGCILESNINERKAWQSETISMLFLYLGIEDWTEWRLYFEQTGRIGKKSK